MKKTDFEVFDALMVDSQKCSDVSGMNSYFIPRVQAGAVWPGHTLSPLPLTLELPSGADSGSSGPQQFIPYPVSPGCWSLTPKQP